MCRHSGVSPFAHPRPSARGARRSLSTDHARSRGEQRGQQPGQLSSPAPRALAVGGVDERQIVCLLARRRTPQRLDARRAAAPRRARRRARARRGSPSAPAQRPASRSTNTAHAAPRESASMPSAPRPREQVQDASLRRSPTSIENSASRTRSEVGRVPRPGGACRRRPRAVRRSPASRDGNACAIYAGALPLRASPSAPSSVSPSSACSLERQLAGPRRRSPRRARGRAPAARRPPAAAPRGSSRRRTGACPPSSPSLRSRRSISARLKPSSCSASARSRGELADPAGPAR